MHATRSPGRIIVYISVLMGLVAALTLSSVDAQAENKRSRIREVKSWGYQLQGRKGNQLKASELAASDFDLLVIDYADGEKPWTREELRKIQRKPDGSRRIVLAYFSIGEAEDYRFYWKKSWKKDPPPFLAAANKDWGGNYKVRYWLPEWQRIIVGSKDSNGSYLDKIIEAGFDGVYLDIIDAFEFFGPEGDEPERPKAAQDMCQLVARIAKHARVHKKQPGFLIVPQNGATILDEMSKKRGEAYMATVDAIAAEDTFYFGDDDHNNALRPQKDTIKALRRFREHGLPVFAVDYLTRESLAKTFVSLARDKDFIPYVGHRELDRLVVQPGSKK